MAPILKGGDMGLSENKGYLIVGPYYIIRVPCSAADLKDQARTEYQTLNPTPLSSTPHNGPSKEP